MKLATCIDNYIFWKSLNRPSMAKKSKDLYKWFDLDVTTVDDVVINGLISKWRLTLKPKTINLNISILKGFFKYCKVKGYNIYNEIDLLQNVHDPEEAQSVVSDRMMQNVLDSYFHRDPFIYRRNLCILNMLWDTGMRVSELCDLDIDSLNTAHLKWFEDRAQVLYLNITSKKSRRIRFVSWFEDTHTSKILPYLAHRLDREPQSNALFISNKSRKKLSTREVERIISSAFLRCGYKDISPHSIRRGFAHEIYKQTRDINALKEKLGHTSIISTQKYLKLSKDTYFTFYRDIMPSKCV